MADITMCSGIGCNIKDTCYRHTAKASEYWQSYFSNPPVENGKCDMYWGNVQNSIISQLKNITKPCDIKCKHVKREGSSCSLNNNCKYPSCD